MFVEVAQWAALISKIATFLFVDVALWAASILKNNIFYIYLISSRLQNSLIWLDLIELLVLKNAVECTSQRLKRTAGAQVMTFLL